MTEEAKYEMLYCDQVSCRVNTFEAGTSGKCPGCEEVGFRVSDGSQWP